MMDLHNYPMDEQNCTLEIESYGYTTDDVTFSWYYGNSSIEGINNLTMAQFTLVEHKVITRVITFKTAGAYARLSLSFRLRRSIGFFILQTYLPSILLVILSWISFWINHEATSARVALGITTVLTMTTISTSVRASLPRISYIKSIDIYVVVCYAFVFSALVEYAFVNFHYWSKQKKKAIEANKTSTSSTNSKKYKEDSLDDYNTQVALRLAQVDDVDGDADTPWREEIGLRRMNGPEPPSYTTAITPSPVRYRTTSLKYKQRTWSNGRVRKNSRGRKKKFKFFLSRMTDVDTIDRFARFIFPTSFVVFNIVYWYSYLTKLYNR
ncbi:Gamma-aminobutyric acid receptor subunit beta-3 [Holothuria leucospilota]|uniref:Gamma-aminobutyric acid receptor subunit beta-3 n=1 Tax=Holothuria leucospilota TaxID=206669 RepID=A0A9Q1BK24_HOLLE|nr:Gamma-aminobutyric acid receptor subunit beta-3 [Holothuria leucospilota]